MIMADYDRVVPIEDDAKAKAAQAAGGSGAGDGNSVEKAPQETSTDATSVPKIRLRNMIQVPYNCPDGSTMDEDGVCREVF